MRESEAGAKQASRSDAARAPMPNERGEPLGEHRESSNYIIRHVVNNSKILYQEFQ